MTNSRHRVRGGGLSIEGCPRESVLRHEIVPDEVAEAYDASRAAVERRREAARTLAAAERAAREASVLPTDAKHRDQLRAEVHAATREEREADRVEQQATKRAGDRLAALLDEHREEIRRASALLTLGAHVREVDALVEAHEASADRVGPSVPAHPMRPAWEGPSSSSASRSALEEADLVNTQALAEIAGTRLDLVEVRDKGRAARVLTTPRRARLLVEEGGHRSKDWTLVEDEEGTR